MGQQVNVYESLNFFPGATVKGMPGKGQGRTYYVNNMTGTDGASGLSWRHAMAQINEAVTASETYRQLGQGRSGDTRNDYIRNTIVIQGTSQITTAYSAADYYDKMTDLPHHADMIGLGDHFVGMDKGTVIIGAINSNDYGIEDTGTTRGLSMYNIMVGGDGSGNSAMLVGTLLRSRFEDCSFAQHTESTQTDDMNAGFECTGNFAHNLVRHCVFGQANGSKYPAFGMDLELTGNGMQNLVEDNIIFGKTTGILMSKSDNWFGSVFRNNIISSLHGTCASTGVVVGLYCVFVNNFVSSATDAIDATSAYQVVGNITVTGTTGGTETQYTS